MQLYLSARELNQQGCLYNMRHGVWFQRQEELRVVAPEYERGNYVYFDPSMAQKGQGRGFVVRSKETALSSTATSRARCEAPGLD